MKTIPNPAMSEETWEQLLGRYRRDLMSMATRSTTPPPAPVQAVAAPAISPVEAAAPAAETVADTVAPTLQTTAPAVEVVAESREEPVLETAEDAIIELMDAAVVTTALTDERVLADLYTQNETARAEMDALRAVPAAVEPSPLELVEETATEPLFSPRYGTTGTARYGSVEEQPVVATQAIPTAPLEQTRTEDPTPVRDPYDDTDYTETAKLIVQVTSARQAIPVEDATVTVTRRAGENREVTLAVLETDQNGRTDPITLSAPPQYQSETPGFDSPYARVNVQVVKPGYFTQTVMDATLFSGITSLVPVNIEPLPVGQATGEEVFVVGGYDL